MYVHDACCAVLWPARIHRWGAAHQNAFRVIKTSSLFAKSPAGMQGVLFSNTATEDEPGQPAV